MITYKLKDLWVQFTPLEDGKARYRVTIHDFDNLDGWNGVLEYSELQSILDNPYKAMSIARTMGAN